jgi:hypothetical protein
VRFARAEDGLIGRWPRRLATLACLLLALLAAARQPTERTAPDSGGPVPVAGQRALPVGVAADPRAYLHVGDLVELLASPATESAVLSSDPSPLAVVVAPGAVILSIGQPNGAVGDATWPLVVSVDEQAARRIAALNGRPVLAVLTGPP